MKKEKVLLTSLLLFGFVVATVQDISGKKGCDCSICNSGNNRLDSIVNRKHEEGGKSSCNICERRKEMLRMERERQKQFEKCPFEILGVPAMRGKSSDEIFDEFRELIIPSQNSFFDMMRGIVKTVHVSTEAELKEAREKEARKKAAEARRAFKMRRKPPVEEPPKVTVVLKQTPCGQVLKQNQEIETVKVPLIKRLPKEIRDAFPFLDQEPTPKLNHQFPGLAVDDASVRPDPDMDRSVENDELMRQLFDNSLLMSTTEEDKSAMNEVETMTESPYVKFMSNEGLRSHSGRRAEDFVDLGLESLATPLFNTDWGLVDVKHNFLSPTTSY